jgi:hypothetical protein
MAALQRFLQTDEAAEAMRSDGIRVRPDTMLMLEEVSGQL